MTELSVGEDYPKQQARLRKLRVEAAKLPVHSVFFYLMELDSLLHRAEAAAISGDIVEVLRAYNEMREFES